MTSNPLKSSKLRRSLQATVATELAVVLVGTYKERQLAWIKRQGIYNYPVKDGDELTDEACRKISEIGRASCRERV